MLKRLGFHTLDSFLYHLIRREVTFQIYGFRFLPWCFINDNNGEIEYTNLYAGWLFIQCRWVHV